MTPAKSLTTRRDEIVDQFLRVRGLTQTIIPEQERSMLKHLCKEAFDFGAQAKLTELKADVEPFESIYQQWIDANGSRSPSIRFALGWMYHKDAAKLAACRAELEAHKSCLTEAKQNLVDNLKIKDAERARNAELESALERIANDEKVVASNVAREALKAQEGA